VAADASSDFAFLAAAARRSIEDLRRAARTVPPLVGQRGVHFLAVVEATLDALDRAVDDREREFGAATDDTARDSVVRAMRLINHHVMNFHQATPWIDSARRSEVGLGLTYFVNEMSTALLKEPADVVMTPTAQYMYLTYHKPFEPALTGLGASYPTTVPDVIVAYPAQEPDSLFLQLLIAHELGHSAIAEHNLIQEVYRRDSDQAATRDALSRAVSEFATIEGHTSAEAVALIRRMLRNWIAELVCDGLALAYLGPSFILTFAAFMTPFGGPVPSATHPPHTLRTQLLIERIDSWGWNELLKSAVPITFSWIKSAGETPQEAGHRTYYVRLEEAIRGLSETIELVLVDHLGPARYEPHAYSQAGDQLRELLAQDVLPAQLIDRSAADRRSIILAGWLHQFNRHNDEPVALVRIIGDRDFQRFLTRALEMSAVLEQWTAL
jgi:hypothetical protein